MKYLAILKDSWREALDTWVLYALLLLSILVIVGVASIGFTPRSAENGIQDIVSRFDGGRSAFARLAPLRYEVADFEQLDQKPPWEGSYRFTLVVNEVVVKDPQGQEQTAEGMFRFMVWMSTVQQEESKLTDEDRATRKRLLQLRQQMSTVKPQDLEKALNDKMREEIKHITPAQMVRFVTQQLVSHGTLDAESIRYKPGGPEAAAFVVEASPRSETFRTWPHSISYGFGAIRPQGEVPIGPRLFWVESILIGAIGAGVTMLISSVVTSFFIPNMLRKGTVDLLISKPIHRSALLVYKFIGGLTFMFLNTVVVVVGVWVVLGLRSGIWAPGFLWSIFILTFQFAIFYAISTLVAVLTRSPIVAILAACFGWVLLFGLGWVHRFLDATRELELAPAWVYTTSDTAHFVLPRYKDLDALNDRLISSELLGPESEDRKAIEKIYGSISWGQSIAITVGFIALMLGLSCWRFSTRDY